MKVFIQLMFINRVENTNSDFHKKKHLSAMFLLAYEILEHLDRGWGVNQYTNV